MMARSPVGALAVSFREVARAESVAGCQIEEMKTPVEVPPDVLSREALEGLVEEFVTREGTDYGLREHTLDEKRQRVLAQIEKREVVILFDIESESTTLIPRAELSATIKTSDPSEPEEP